MSGICGVLALNGKPVAEADLDRMLAPLERRGPDGTHGWIDGATALGHTSLATTPEALDERLPYTYSPGGCTITSDARLDNSADLLATLGIADTQIGDGELILRAYLKWGTDCATHLLGDFAFAIWDAREETLFCARDITGMRQLNYYCDPGKLFAFATEPHAILQHPEVPCRINEGRIGDFLEGLEAYDLTSTFYTGVHRLPPGHALLLRSDTLRVWKYGELTPQPRLTLPSDAAYAEAFCEVFTEAVRVRLRSPAPVGSMLSGGMDSGSVSAVAAQLLQQTGSAPLGTFSAVGTDSDCPETSAIEAALAIDHIAPTRIPLSEMDAYRADLEKLVRESAEPFDANMTLLFAVYLAAQRAGHKVMLDGVGGDTTLGSPNMIGWHLRGGRISQAWREAKGEERFWEEPEPALKTFIRGARQAFIPQWARDARRALRGKQVAHTDSLLSLEFTQRVNMAERLRANALHVAPPRGDGGDDRQRRVLHPYVIVARERYDRVASRLAIEPRDPFLDRRVLEFCLSLPAEQLQKDGWPKIILRRAMVGRVPDGVRWRAGKEHLGWEFTQSLWGPSLAKRQSTAKTGIEKYIETNASDYESLQDEGAASIAASLTIRYLEAWISKQGRIDPSMEKT